MFGHVAALIDRQLTCFPLGDRTSYSQRYTGCADFRTVWKFFSIIELLRFHPAPNVQSEISSENYSRPARYAEFDFGNGDKR